MSSSKKRNAILDKEVYDRAKLEYKRLVEAIADIEASEDAEEVKAMRFAYQLSRLKAVYEQWPQFFYDISRYYPPVKEEAKPLNCLRCGMNPLIHLEGREYHCTVCEKTVIISTDNYGLSGKVIMEELGNTVLFKSRQ